MSRIFPPLKVDHWLVTGGALCGICHLPFHEGQRTTLAAIELSSEDLTKVAMLLHATCAVKGRKTRVGIIDRIKDGNGSPFPVLTEDGKQWHFREAGLDGD